MENPNNNIDNVISTVSDTIDTVKDTTQPFFNNVRNRSVAFLSAALTLVVGLSWNETIQTGIESIYPRKQDLFTGMLIYSLVLTIMVILFIEFVFPKMVTDPSKLPPMVPQEF